MADNGKFDAYHNPDLSMSIQQRVEAIANSITSDPDYTGWDTQVLRHVHLSKVQPGRIEWTFTVLPSMCNKAKNLHGGCSTTILDNLSSCTFLTIAKPGFMDQGTVSRTITMTFLRPVPAGAKVRVVCEAVSAGRTLAHAVGRIETLEGKVCVTMIHDKAVVPRPAKL